MGKKLGIQRVAERPALVLLNLYVRFGKAMYVEIGSILINSIDSNKWRVAIGTVRFNLFVAWRNKTVATHAEIGCGPFIGVDRLIEVGVP